MAKMNCFYLLFFFHKIELVFTHAKVFEGFYQRVTHFDGIFMEYLDVSKGRCTTRCFAVTCRGIQFDGGICRILYETTDVPENERTKYNQTSITSDEENEILINVNHKCSSQSPCSYGGACEAVDWIYQCNCTGTDHYGPKCETAGNPWASPDGWGTLHPQLHLNLDDQTPYFMHSGAMHVATENGYGFKTNGGAEYVDLGDWSNETCFVDIERCEQGFTMLAYVNVYDASPANAAGNYQGYITGMVQNNNKRYGPVLFGYHGLGFELIQRNGDHFSAVMDPGVLNFPTGWIRVMVIYQVNTRIQLYVNNQLEAETTTFFSGTASTGTDGRIVLGRHLVNTDQNIFRNGKLTVDWLTIWDRLLTDEERNLAKFI